MTLGKGYYQRRKWEEIFVKTVTCGTTPTHDPHSTDSIIISLLLGSLNFTGTCWETIVVDIVTEHSPIRAHTPRKVEEK